MLGGSGRHVPDDARIASYVNVDILATLVVLVGHMDIKNGTSSTSVVVGVTLNPVDVDRIEVMRGRLAGPLETPSRATVAREALLLGLALLEAGPQANAQPKPRKGRR